MKIVICDDDKDIMELVEFIVKDLGQIAVCSDEENKIVDIIRKENATLLIIDYWLKEGTADNVTIMVKKEFPKIPIILMSAVDNVKQISEDLKLDGYIKKPFDIDSFKNLIGKFHDTNNSNH